MSTLLQVVIQMGRGMGPGGWGFGFVGLGLLLVVLGIGAYVAVRAVSNVGTTTGARPTSSDANDVRAASGRDTASDDPALAELRRRYARGEIDDEEFEERARRLRGDSET